MGECCFGECGTLKIGIKLNILELLSFESQLDACKYVSEEQLSKECLRGSTVSAITVKSRRPLADLGRRG